MVSDAEGSVEDLAPGSSPTTASTPPVGGHPMWLAWRMASAARSRPGAFPYHMPDHPIEAGRRHPAHQLAAQKRSGRQLLVDRRLVDDPVLGEDIGVPLQLHVQDAERRALIAGDQGAGRRAVASVTPMLGDQQLHQRLHAGDEGVTVGEVVLVLEADVGGHPGRPVLLTGSCCCRRSRRSSVRSRRRNRRSRGSPGPRRDPRVRPVGRAG